MLDFQKVETTSSGSKYIQPGVHDNVKITGIKKSDGYDSIVMSFEKQGTGETAEHRFFMDSEVKTEGKKSSLQESAEMFLHIASKVMDEKQFKSKMGQCQNTEEIALRLSALLVGKVLRLKFMSREIQGSDGKKNWFKAQLPRFNFAESMETNPTRLVYDPSNKWDMKRLPSVSSQVSINENLPF